MNKLLKRGFSAYKIFLKNKLTVSAMMLVSGIIMTIAAINGQGNDTKTLPMLITSAGVAFSLWAFYRFGYLKAGYDDLSNKQEREASKHALVLQLIEALAYLIVTAAGVYLLMNESLVNLILNLMAGGLMVFNGIIGVVSLIKRRANRNWRWVVRLVLTLVELAFGTYFVIDSNSIETKQFLAMGILTAIAGIIEIISSYSREAVKNTVEDGKEAVRILKNGDAPQKDGSN